MYYLRIPTHWIYSERISFSPWRGNNHKKPPLTANFWVTVIWGSKYIKYFISHYITKEFDFLIARIAPHSWIKAERGVSEVVTYCLLVVLLRK